MPELPDVENYRRYLTRQALKERVEGVTVRAASIIKGLSGAELSRRLTGRTLEGARRHGKYLLALLDDGRTLTFHFGMTGFLAHYADDEQAPEHERLRLDFANGRHLAYVNMRMLGRVELVDDADAFIRDRELGPDALSVDRNAFEERICAKRSSVKAAFMDQKVLAGIGNIYSDEILFQAKVHPKTSTADLDHAALGRLYRQTQRVLGMAIDKGAGAEGVERRVPRSWLLPHRRANAKCPRCGGRIETLKMGGRSVYLCPRCQPR